MRTAQFFVSLIFAVSLLSVSVFAQITTDKPNCSAITTDDAKTSVGMAMGRLGGLCKEYFQNPQQLTFFVLLPAVLFGIVIYGVLEEIHLFSSKPSIHVALAILMSLMLLPTGVFGAIALSIYSIGAMAAVVSVGAVFMLGLTFWARRKVHSFGYGGAFSGGLMNWITAASIGLIGYMIGGTIDMRWQATAVGAALGYLWSRFGSKGSMLTGGNIDKRIRELEKRLAQIQKQRDEELIRFNSLSPTAPSRPAVQNNINSMQSTVDTIQTEMKELYEKRSNAYTQI